MQENIHYRAGLYLRLSKDDDQAGESFSIGTQRSILMDYCESHQYEVCEVYVDDGYSV
jgi:DNA invertase Pin-like site-specific DNA recombinase